MFSDILEVVKKLIEYINSVEMLRIPFVLSIICLMFLYIRRVFMQD